MTSSGPSGNSVAVIGAGPAGIACAVQLKRSGLEPWLWEKKQPGGCIRQAHRVENYPGFPGGISGDELADHIGEALRVWNIPLRTGEVARLGLDDRAVVLENGFDRWIFSRAVVASGTRPRRLSGEVLKGGDSHRIVYDIHEAVRQKPESATVLGGGDVAVDWAMSLANVCPVDLYFRGERPACLPLLHERAVKKGVRFYGNHSLRTVEDTGEELRLNFDVDSAGTDLLMPAIGREPCLDFLDSDCLNRREELRREGVLFMIGDVVDGPYRQVAISAGDGLRAAMEIERRWR